MVSDNVFKNGNKEKLPGYNYTISEYVENTWGNNNSYSAHLNIMQIHP